MHELISKSANSIVELLRIGAISPQDTLDALESRIEEVDGEINALPTVCFERARERAEAGIDSRLPLAGLPVAIKDLSDVAGVRTTYGSKLFEHHVPETSTILVDRIETNGGIVYAKSNTPEFGTGGNTFNDVFGATRNPYDLSLSAGGSSGGAAAALASGCAWLAQGSDLGGSLRTPASFCGVTSLRPSPGLIATGPGLQPFDVYAQKGPMARDIADLALFADAMAGTDSRAGLAKPYKPGALREAVAQPVKPTRIAFSENLGVCELSTKVASAFGRTIALLQQEGIALEAAHPDLGRAMEAFAVFRALDYAQSLGADLERTREILKPEIVWNVEQGLALDAAQIRSALDAQGQVFNNAASFMQDFDLLICPATIMPAYPVEERYPGFGDGLEYAEYYRWLSICCAITATTLPVITLPCGKTEEGLPVGLQLIGKPHGEEELFSLAGYLEPLFEWDPLQRINP